MSGGMYCCYLSLFTDEGPILACQGCWNEVPQTEGLQQQKCIVSKPWRPTVLAGLVPSESGEEKPIAGLSPCLPVIFPLCVCVCVLTFVSYKAIGHVGQQGPCYGLVLLQSPLWKLCKYDYSLRYRRLGLQYLNFFFGGITSQSIAGTDGQRG